MPLYTSTGAFNVAVNDTTGTGRYSASGALRINLVTGASYVGLYAADGALNVVDVSGIAVSTYGGLYHPSGAIRGRTAPTTLSGLQAPDGSYYFLGLFSPLNLFANGEQGAWYDPSDLSTMFQDSAGTTPVTAVEQPVGLLLDKSKGLALGSDGISGSYTGTATGVWAITATSVTRSGIAGNATVSLPGIVALDANKTYLVSFTVAGLTGDSISFKLPSVGGNNGQISSNGTYSYRVKAAGTTSEIQFIAWAGTTGTVTITNISVRELLGNHASQSTAASRPVLSARVNLLTYSEQFDNAAWASTLGGVGTVTKSTTNAGTAPDGTTTADRVIFSLNGGTATTDIALLRQNNATTGALTFSIAAKSYDGTSSYEMQIIKPDGTAQSITVTGTWQRFTVTGTASGAVNYGLRLRGGQAPTNSDTADVLLWGADLRVTNVGVGLPAYQRVAAATDYDTSGFPLYLKFDGTDDSLATGSIDPGSVDKAQVFAGVRRTAVSAAFQCLIETSASTDSNNGVVALFSQSDAAGARIYSQSKGTIALQAYADPGVFPNVTTNVLTGQSNIAAPSLSLRSNGASVASTTSSQGTGNYLAYPLYIGRRAGSSLPFNGNLYSLIVRFSAANLSDAQIASTETYVNNLTKAY